MPHSMQFSKRLKRDKLSGNSTGLDGNPARADSSTLSGSEASASQVIAILAADMRWKKALTSTTRSLTIGKLRSGSRRRGAFLSHTSVTRVIQGSFSTPLIRRAHEPQEEWWQARRKVKLRSCRAHTASMASITFAVSATCTVFAVDLETEGIGSETAADSDDRTPDHVDLEVTNPNVDGLGLRDVPFALESGIVFSRLYREGSVNVPADDSVIHLGDVVRLVGPKTKLLEFERVIGCKSAIDLKTVPSELTTERLYVTKRSVLGKSLRELNFEQLYGAVVTRVTRAEVEFAARDDVRLQFGDLLFVVGSEGGVAKVAGLVGNKPKALDHPHVLPVFVGILLGVILGSVPMVLPGTPAPVRLGLAGGPLIIALVLSQIGRAGPLIWYLTPGANFALREIGMVLFLACVGLKSGSRFLEVLISGSGAYWMLAGAFLTLFPLVLVGFVARIVLKLNFATICGVLAGSMTRTARPGFRGNHH